MKKIKTTNTNFEINTRTAMVVTIGNFKFIKEELFPWVDIFLIGGETDEFIEQHDGEEICNIVDFEDFKVFSLNWSFNNVEVLNKIDSIN